MNRWNLLNALSRAFSSEMATGSRQEPKVRVSEYATNQKIWSYFPIQLKREMLEGVLLRTHVRSEVSEVIQDTRHLRFVVK